MLELWHNTETDEYILMEDGNEEKLSKMVGDFLRGCAETNVSLEEENRRLREYIKRLGALEDGI